MATLLSLYQEHGATIYGRTLMFCTPAEAARITVEVFTTVWAEVDRIDPMPRDVRRQLLTICNERILASFDDQPGHRETRRPPGLHNPLRLVPGVLTPSAVALRQLAPAEREAIVHTLHTGMTYRRVAAVTGRSHAAIATHLSHGLRALHQAVGDPADTPMTFADHSDD